MRTEDEGQEHGELFRSVVDAALDAVIVMDARGSVVHWSRQAEVIFGWMRDEVVGQPLSSLVIPPRYREAHTAGLRRFLATGEGRVLNRRVELTAVRRDGREFPVELTVTPFGRSHGLAFTGFVRDITDRKRTEAQLTRQLFEAQLLHQAAMLAAESASVGDALQRCLDIVCRMIGWPVGHAYLPAAGGGELVPTAIRYADGDGAYAALRAVTERTRFGRGVGLPGRVWAAGAPEWIEDVSRHEGFPRARLLPDLGVRAAFAFPVKTGAETLAVLEFFTGEAVPPDPRLLLLVQSAGEQVGRLIERKRAEEQRELLLAELSHRVKNTLAVVQAIAAQTGKRATTLPGFLDAFWGRLRALAAAHDLLTENDWRGVSLHGLARASLLPHLGAGDGRLRIEGADLTLKATVAQTFALVFHELATNALKHGALSVPDGRVGVTTLAVPDESGGELRVAWRERGGPPVEAPARRGFGMILLQQTIEHQHGGTVELDWRRAGLVCRLALPLAEVAP